MIMDNKKAIEIFMECGEGYLAKTKVVGLAQGIDLRLC